MLLDKFKVLFNDNKREPSHYYYTYKTHLHKTIFYMDDELSYKEKKINAESLKVTNIVSITQGKKLFYRFLKNNSAYQKYISCICRFRLNQDSIIKESFATPFQRICANLRHFDIFKKDVEEFLDLEKKWIKFLISIRYIKDFDY